MLVQIADEEDSETLSQVMKRIGIRYAMYYNYKYNRFGPVYQERYRSETIGSDAYFLTVLRYIHRNPVKAGIVKSPVQYQWSSYGEYLRSSAASFVYCNLGKKLLGSQFTSYMEADSSEECFDIKETAVNRRMNDLELASAIEKIVNWPAPAIINLDRNVRDNVIKQIVANSDAPYKQIARVTGISPSQISRIIRK